MPNNPNKKQLTDILSTLWEVFPHLSLEKRTNYIQMFRGLASDLNDENLSVSVNAYADILAERGKESVDRKIEKLSSLYEKLSDKKKCKADELISITLNGIEKIVAEELGEFENAKK